MYKRTHVPVPTAGSRDRTCYPGLWDNDLGRVGSGLLWHCFHRVTPENTQQKTLSDTLIVITFNIY